MLTAIEVEATLEAEVGVEAEVEAIAEAIVEVGAEVFHITVIQEAGPILIPPIQGVVQDHDHIQGPEVDLILPTHRDRGQEVDHHQLFADGGLRVFLIKGV